jgi:hypothetical protein
MQQWRLANWWQALLAVIIATETQRNANLRQSFAAIVVASKTKWNLDKRQAFGPIVVTTPFANAVWHRAAQNPAARFTRLRIGCL